jgi:hypothetical protein
MVLWEIIATCEAPADHPNKAHSSHGFGGRYPSSHQSAGRFDLIDHPANSWQRLPFGECESQKEVRQKVLNGERPSLPRGHNSKYTDLILRGWQSDARLRPSASEMSIVVESCWLDAIHHLIFETAHLVDVSAVHAACASNAAFHQQFADDTVSAATRRRNFQPPSPQLLSALAVMQLEEKWLLLEDQGAFAITTSAPPHSIVWATRSWCKLTGYLLNEVLSLDIITLFQGSSVDRELVTALLNDAAMGKPAHCVCRHSSRSKEQQAFLNSIHAFPVYASSSSSLFPELTQHASNNISQSIPFMQSSETKPLLSDSSTGEQSNSRDSIGPRSVSSVARSSSQLALSSPLSSFFGSLRYSSASSSSPRTTSAQSFISSQTSSSHRINRSSNLLRENVSSSFDWEVAYIAVQFSALKNIRS